VIRENNRNPRIAKTANHQFIYDQRDVFCAFLKPNHSFLLMLSVYAKELIKQRAYEAI
jgi:hypothetical protein